MARRLRLVGLTLVTAALLSPAGGPGSAAGSRRAALALTQLAEQILSGNACPCGCTNGLPGSGRHPECFGCAVAKAEGTFVLESLAAGMDPADVMVRLGEPVLIDVFADYTDPGLPETWQRARRIAAEFDQHRVVLRTPAASVEATRALKLAECAREQGRFTRLQSLLIVHAGPWDEASLLRLAARAGAEREATRLCLERIDLAAQIAKDRDHAKERRLQAFPALFVNRVVTANRDEALREALRRVLRERSL